MLDSFPAFTNSDMRNDKPLVALFKRCGCGHLFSLLDLEDEARQMPRQAQIVRDHLRIRELDGRVHVGRRTSSSKKTTPTRAGPDDRLADAEFDRERKTLKQAVENFESHRVALQARPFSD